MSAATAEHVREVARELGYRPTWPPRRCGWAPRARSALLVPDITNPFFSRVLRGAQRAAQAAGYTVALVDTGNDRRWEAQSFEALRAGPVDGYLLFEVAAPPELGRRRARRPDRVHRAAARVGALRRAGRRGAAFEHLSASATAASATWPRRSTPRPSTSARRPAGGCWGPPASTPTRCRAC